LVKKHLEDDQPLFNRIEAVIASPSTRTVQTALLVFGDLLDEKGLKLELDPRWQGTVLNL